MRSRALFAQLWKGRKSCHRFRATYSTDGKNPFSFDEVKKFIDDDLSPGFKGKYEIIDLPNVTNFIYGRDVGYKVEKISFSDDIENISAINIRKEMNITPVKHDVKFKKEIKDMVIKVVSFGLLVFLDQVKQLLQKVLRENFLIQVIIFTCLMGIMSGMV